MTIDQRLEAHRYNIVYKQGETAAIDKLPFSTCPYSDGSAEKVAWLDGFIDGAQYLRRVTG